MKRYFAEELWFRGPSKAEVVSKLADQMNFITKDGHYELIAVQQLEEGSRLATENSFEYSARYLLVWRRTQ